jgi:imidazolonepropionase-like amidohydrolase
MKGQDAGIPIPSPELQAAVVEAAHKHGLITLSHALTQKSTLAVLKAGTDGLAHCFCDEKPSKELLDAYKKNNSFLVPTLIVAATLTGEELASSNDFVQKDVVKKLTSEEARECFCKRMMMGKEGCSVEYAYEVVKMLKGEGIDIVA